MKKNEIKQIILEEIKSVLSEMGPDPELYPDGLDFPEAGDMSPEEMAADSRPEEGEMDMDMDLEEMARTPNVFALAREASMKDVIHFMNRVNDVLKTYKSPGQKKPKKRFTPEEMKALAVAMVNPEGFTSKDVIAATSYNSPAQANKFLAALEQKGLIKLTSQLKKAMDTPAKPKDAPDVDDFDGDFNMGDFEDLDLSDPLSEMIKSQVSKLMKEAKSPLAKKMKEVEARGRIAALETKLAAVQEMIEETEGRLSRIDEDNEFSEMMDKKAVKDVRKQLKELERAQAKLQKEYDKVSGGRKKEKVVDEDAPVDEDAVDFAMDEMELEEDNMELNESFIRMKKLANLKG
jgi:vacuolar-type H+-ATPase subunit I/STV1